MVNILKFSNPLVWQASHLPWDQDIWGFESIQEISINLNVMERIQGYFLPSCFKDFPKSYKKVTELKVIN